MKVAVDTNVLVSGLLKPLSPSGEIIRHIISGNIILCCDARILQEYESVLKRPKFNFGHQDVDNFLEFIKTTSILVLGIPLKYHLPDPSDEPFVEIAIAGNAEYLITGNTKHFPKSKCEHIFIASPKTFIERFE